MLKMKKVGDVFGAGKMGECFHCGHVFTSSSEACAIDPKLINGAGGVVCESCAKKGGV